MKNNPVYAVEIRPLETKKLSDDNWHHENSESYQQTKLKY